MDADLIISAVAVAVVVLMGANTWLLLVVRDRVGQVDKRVEGQGQRISRLAEWLEDQAGPKRSRRNGA